MKTSNKILLIFFGVAVLMMTAVHLTLYAKYKRGEVSAFEEIRDGRFDEHTLPKIKYVSVTGFRRCNIIPAAERKIKIFKMNSTRLAYKVVNDTLVITADSSMTKEDFEHENQVNQTINLYLPGTEEISAFHTQLFLNGGTDSVTAPSWTVNLSQSDFNTADFKGKAAYLSQLLIKTNSSSVTLNHGTVINQLNIQATRSTISNQNADIGHLQLSVDDNSTIILQGRNIKDINVIKQ